MAQQQQEHTTSTARVTTQVVSTELLCKYLFAISQYCRAVSDLTDEDKRPTTAFHSLEEPPFSLSDYIIGIGRRLRLNRLTVLLAAVYVARTAQRTGRSPSILSIHRLYAAALLLAVKVRGDAHPINDAVFAAAAGLPRSEVAELLHVLHSVNAEDLTDYETDMEIMYVRLEAAIKLTLRSDIAAAVAKAFEMPTPAAWGIFRPPQCLTPSSAAFRRRALSDTFSQRSGASFYTDTAESNVTEVDDAYVAGSAISAARSLRSTHTSPADFSVTVSDPEPQLALATFAPLF